jgi:hypothetical protein
MELMNEVTCSALGTSDGVPEGNGSMGVTFGAMVGERVVSIISVGWVLAVLSVGEKVVRFTSSSAIGTGGLSGSLPSQIGQWIYLEHLDVEEFDQFASLCCIIQLSDWKFAQSDWTIDHIAKFYCLAQ